MAMNTEYTAFDSKELTTDPASFNGSKVDSPDFAEQHWQTSFSQALGIKPSQPDAGAPYFFLPADGLWQQAEGNSTEQAIEMMLDISQPPAANAGSPSQVIKMEEADNDINISPASSRPVTRRSAQGGCGDLSLRKSATPEKGGRVTKVLSRPSTNRVKKSRPSSRKSEEHKMQTQLVEKKKEKTRSRSKAQEQEEATPAPAEGDEAQESRQKFLARNRVAASKCRQKKKEFVETLQDEAKRLEEDNGKLQETWRCLLAERTLLKNSVMAHGHCGDPNINSWVKAEAERIVRTRPSDDKSFTPGAGEIAATLSETMDSRRGSIAQSSPESAAQHSTTSSSLPPLVHSSPDSPELAALLNVPSPAPFDESPDPEPESSTDFMSATLTSLITMDSPAVKDEPDAFNYDYMPQSMFEDSLLSIDCQS